MPQPATIGTIPKLTCPAGFTFADIDFVPGAPGGSPDLETATRELRGVRWSDVVAIDGDMSGAVRDGRGVFSAVWSIAPNGGWLLVSYHACADAGIALMPPRGLVRDAIAEVLVDGVVAVRLTPGHSAVPASGEAVLRSGDLLLIVDGPVPSGGSDWYLVSAMPEGLSGGPFGWVAAASPAGVPWIDDAVASTCPTLPDDARQLGVLPEELLLHCFGPMELSFELEANVYCLPSEGPAIEPGWFTDRCGALSGDACGTCDIPLAVDPRSGALPGEEDARWSFRGHFDDPAAASCRPAEPGAADDLTIASIVLGCRTTFVLTSLVRLGDASG